MPPLVTDQASAVVALLRDVLGDELVGVYLYGSAVLGGLQHDSDLDLLALAARSLDAAEKTRIVDGLLVISSPGPWDRDARAGERPLEVTIIATPELVPWRFPPRMELQYGEWLRASLVGGDGIAGEPEANPDLALLVEQARREGRALVGPKPRLALPPVPPGDLAAAILDGVDGLLAELPGDTTNVLLTLARMWLTLATGEISPKDLAADWALRRIPAEDRPILERARSIYLGEVEHRWREPESRVRSVADRLAGEVRRAGAELAADRGERARHEPERHLQGA